LGDLPHHRSALTPSVVEIMNARGGRIANLAFALGGQNREETNRAEAG